MHSVLLKLRLCSFLIFVEHSARVSYTSGQPYTRSYKQKFLLKKTCKLRPERTGVQFLCKNEKI